MEIFGKHLFSTDAEWFRGACKKEQKKWILENTDQKDEGLINEFLSSKMNDGKEECLGCKEAKNGNISKGNVEETAAVDQSIDASKHSVGDNPKRPKKS